ncbi:MAG: TIGR02996 domain-containing protein [Polyangiaceae bacterium]
MRSAAHLEELFAAVVANPDDVAARLVLADALHEIGDVRGELIQLQHRHDQLAERHPERAALAFKIKRLVAAHASTLAGEVARYAAAWELTGGFVSEVTMTAASFGRHGPRLFAAHPIETLRLRPLDRASLEVLAAEPALAILRGLWLHGHRGELSRAPLGRSPNLASLAVLRLTDVELEATHAREALAQIAAPRLARLVVRGAPLAPSVLFGLAENVAAPPIERLELACKGSVDAAELATLFGAFGSAPAFARLRALSLESWFSPRWAVESWLSGPNAAQLEHLHLGAGVIGDVVAHALAEGIARPVELDLTETSLGRGALQVLLDSPAAERLKTLRVPFAVRQYVPPHLCR